MTPAMVVSAAGLVKQGKIISMALPYDDAAPQTGHMGRFNPIHLIIRDGADVAADTTIRDFYGGVDKHIRGTDDLIIMPHQSGTQWDALGHIVFEGKRFTTATERNGYRAREP